MSSYPPSFNSISVVFFACMNVPSYDAAEDNEVTFWEGGHIIEIEEVGEGWWQSKNLRMRWVCSQVHFIVWCMWGGC